MEILRINNKTDIDHLNKLTNSGKDVFILIYMEGCGPCNTVRPEWTKLENILKNKTGNKHNGNKYNNVVIAQVESDYLDNLKLNRVPEGFPTIKHISNKGILEEDFNKERNVNALMEWVNSATSKKSVSGKRNNINQTKKYKSRHYKRTTKKRFSKTRLNTRGRK
jgi:hypothetical protein